MGRHRRVDDRVGMALREEGGDVPPVERVDPSLERLHIPL
jgi:hypothetical protein